MNAFFEATLKRKHFQLLILFLMFTFLLLLGVVLLEKGWLQINVSFSSLLLIITISLCIYSIRSLPRLGFNFFDPGLVFTIYISVVVIPLSLMALLDFEGLQLYYYNRFIDRDIFSKTLLAHMIFIGSFSSSYIILSLSYKNYPQPYCNKIAVNSIWPILACSMILFHVLIQYYYGFLGLNPWVEGGTHVLGEKVRSIGLFSGQIYQKIVLLENSLLIFGIGAILARSSSLNLARIKLITIVLILFVFKFFLTTERGGILIIGLGAAAYADIARWKGELLNKRLVALGITFGFGLNIITSIIESRLLYGIGSTSSVTGMVTIKGGVASVWVTSTIISWIDNLYIPMHYAQNYLNAIMSILPSQLYSKPVVGLSDWFAKSLLPQRAEMGIAFGFSAVAEGYLNARMLGVFIHGFIIGCLAAAIRYLQFGTSLKGYSVFIYSVLFAGFIKIYHVGSVNILKGVQWKLFLSILLVVVAHMMVVGVRNAAARK